jgi:hypothetical protein
MGARCPAREDTELCTISLLKHFVGFWPTPDAVVVDERSDQSGIARHDVFTRMSKEIGYTVGFELVRWGSSLGWLHRVGRGFGLFLKQSQAFGLGFLRDAR